MISRILKKNWSVIPKYGFSTSETGGIKVPIAQRPGIGTTRNVTLVPGYGYGKDLINSVKQIIAAAHCPITWDVIEEFQISKIDDPEYSQKLRKNEVMLLGLLPTKQGDKYVDHFRLYQRLGLFANLVYSKTLPGANTRHKDVDIVVIRENTEGEFSGVEHEVYPGVVESIKVITKEASLRIANYTFEFAYLSGRKKVTAVHKANIMKLCDGLFLEACREVAAQYPFIKYEEMIIDNCCMQVVKNPWQFDVMVMPNLYGSIVGHAVAGICGGAGVTCGANIGEKNVIFEHGARISSDDLVSRDLCNPSALILSSVMMLKHMGLPKFANNIENALEKTFVDGIRTKDIGGSHSLEQFTEAVVNNLQKLK